MSLGAKTLAHACKTPCGSSREANKSLRVIGNKFLLSFTFILNINNLHLLLSKPNAIFNERIRILPTEEMVLETINYLLLDLHPIGTVYNYADVSFNYNKTYGTFLTNVDSN